MKEGVVIKFNKEFVKGNQYIDINTYNGKTFEGIMKDHWWQSREVYNLLAPIVEMIIKKASSESFTDKQLYGKGSIVDRLIPFQRAYNAIKNKQTEYLNRLMYGNLFVEDGSIDIDALENEGLVPGKILIYRQGAQIPKIECNYSVEVYNLIKKEAEEIKEEMYKMAFDYLDNISYKSGDDIIGK